MKIRFRIFNDQSIANKMLTTLDNVFVQQKSWKYLMTLEKVCIDGENQDEYTVVAPVFSC